MIHEVVQHAPWPDYDQSGARDERPVDVGIGDDAAKIGTRLLDDVHRGFRKENLAGIARQAGIHDETVRFARLGRGQGLIHAALANTDLLLNSVDPVPKVGRIPGNLFLVGQRNAKNLRGAQRDEDLVDVDDLESAKSLRATAEQGARSFPSGKRSPTFLDPI